VAGQGEALPSNTPVSPGTSAANRGWRLAAHEFMRNRLAAAGPAILVFFLLFCFVGPALYHTNQMAPDLTDAFARPSAAHLLGTDENGFDELGRVMKGGQAALAIGFLAALIAIVLGAFWGAVAGLAGGIIDSIMMRVVDVFLSIPIVFIVLILAVKIGATVLSLSILIGCFSWLVPARLVRGEVLSLCTRDYVAAARAAGSSRSRLIIRHLLPNAFGVVIVNATFQVADAILLVSFVGFLGFGLHYPSVDWGDQLSVGIQYMQDGYWWLVFPVSACIALTVMALNFVGDALRDLLDVRLRTR
jgi:ABC-type dipeptide/oligopeptide/nickel transport system permease subunit